MKEALRLAGVVNDVKKEVASRGLDVIQLLASQEAASTNPRIWEIIKGAEEKHGQTIAKGGDLTNGLGELLREYKKDNAFYIARWQEVIARLSRVDAQKIANEELLDLMTRARQTMERTPETTELLVASTEIAHFSQFFYYADLLNAFLQFPPAYRRMLDEAGGLLKSIAIDLAGTVVPFFGTITAVVDTVFNLMEPRITKKMEELRQATVLFDRLCDFDDQLTELLGYENFTEEIIGLAGQTLKTTRASFTTDAAWLSAVLGNAER
jgi:hypothetical protein